MVKSGKSKIGILAGGGDFPKKLAYSLQAQQRAFFIIALEGFAETGWMDSFPHKRIRLTHIGEILRTLKREQCQELVLIGPVKRPSWRDILPDLEAMRLLARLGKSIFLGDNGLLVEVVSFLEEEGFHVRGAHEFLSLESPILGALGSIKPDQQALDDISYGRKILSAIAPFDIGQACVVQSGLVLAVEALEGTDKMLQRCAVLKQEGLGGVLIKMPKIGQDLRVDMPTIGPLTCDYAFNAGLRGIAFLAKETLILERELCIEKSHQYGLFLYGFSSSDIF